MPYGTRAPKELLHHLPAATTPAFCVRRPDLDAVGAAGIAVA
ncbi:hypothetical protein F750_4840 [Streptomyces sp. PAMC 26508]|nr:hypothetical protein F750_4840 [Streptomyces sp. PAMC 26508]